MSQLVNLKRRTYTNEREKNKQTKNWEKSAQDLLNQRGKKGKKKEKEMQKRNYYKS